MNTIVDKRAPVNPFIAILIAIIFISSASIIVRYSDAPAIVLAFYRVFLASVILFLFNPAEVIKNIKNLSLRHLLLTFLAGFFLAVHFAAFITSLRYTTIANSVVLVDSAPLLTLALSYLIFKEKSNLLSIISVIVSIIGVAIIGFSDQAYDADFFFGDMLAVLGAVTLAAYLICSRMVRMSIELTPFLTLVYFFSSVLLAVFCIFTGESFFEYPKREYFLFFALALFPTIGGHSLFLYALRYVKAYVVNLGFLGEPIGAPILAYLLFNELPSIYFYLGGSLILAGSITAILQENKKRKRNNF
ncbi:DMT family transporter [candidate division KSB1 bacterium]